MGRLTQVLDFIQRKPLPLEYERDFMYTHIEESNYFPYRKKLKHEHNRKDQATPETNKAKI